MRPARSTTSGTATSPTAPRLFPSLPPRPAPGSTSAPAPASPASSARSCWRIATSPHASSPFARDEGQSPHPLHPHRKRHPQSGLPARGRAQRGPLPGITVEILSKRAESVTSEVNLPLLPRVICARALAPLDRLFALALPLSPPGTTGVWCKGKEVERSSRLRAGTGTSTSTLVPSVTDRDGRIAVTTNLERKAKD